MSLRSTVSAAIRRGTLYYFHPSSRIGIKRTILCQVSCTQKSLHPHCPLSPQCCFLSSDSTKTTSEHEANIEREGEGIEQEVSSLEQHGSSKSIDTNPYAIAISKLCNSGRRDAAQNAETLLKRMEDVAVSSEDLDPPNTFIYNQVISLYGNNGYGQQAENLLRRMQANYVSGKNVFGKPDLITYNACISAWAFSRQRGSAQRAELILKELMSLYTQDTTTNKDMHPDTWSFNTVIAAYSRDPDNSHRASDIINEMIHFAKRHNIPSLTVDSFTLSSVINSLATKKGKGKASGSRQAEAIIERMETLYDAGGNDSLKPDAISYSSLIKVLSKSGEKDAADRSIRLLQRMEERYQEKGDYSLKPDTVAYNSVLSTIANSNNRGENRDCGRQAEKVLQRMHELHNAGNTDVRPNTISYSTAIQAWKNSGEENAGDMAESILRKMKALYEEGDDYVEPNTVCFSTVISALAKSGTREAAERSEELLEEMQSLHAFGELNVEPNTITYTSVIEGWASTGEEGALERAENIVQRMSDLWNAGNDRVAPNTITYNTLIKVVEKCPVHNKATKAESILRHMQESEITKPNIRTYNAVFQACAATDEKKETKARALTVVLRVLNEMRRNNISPNTYTYPSVLKACANLFTGDLEPLDIAFHSCCEDGMVDLMVLSHVRRVAPAYLQKLTGVPTKLLKLENIPKRWTKKVNKMRQKERRR